MSGGESDNTPEGNKTNSKALGVNAVSGKVTNEQGEALPGVVVRCGNTNVQTDLNGEFHVNVNDGDKLTFTYIGYNTITKDADDNNLKVVMTEIHKPWAKLSSLPRRRNRAAWRFLWL